VRDVENFYRYKLRKERPYLDNVIASQLNRCYDGTEEAVRERESDWANLLTDNMRAAYKKFPADVAVINGGSIRIDDTICDTITFESLERTFAFPTQIVFVRLKGKDLRELILEKSVNSGRGEGRFLQVSGVSFRRDASEEGILKNLQLQTAKGVTPFDDNKTYVVAVNKYIFDCGDKYEFRKFVTEYIPAGPDLRALVYTALKQKKPPSKNPQPLGRIIDLPSYALPLTSNPEWKTLSDGDRACPVL
jgi:2',3'-cyclic-nucleotide 2'-phosphodiesterase (5'-nucleotidase family)